MKKISRKILGLTLVFIMFISLSACGSKYIGYVYNLVSAFETENKVVFWEPKNAHSDSYYKGIVKKLNDELTALDKNLMYKIGDGILTDLMKVNNNAGISSSKG